MWDKSEGNEIVNYSYETSTFAVRLEGGFLVSDEDGGKQGKSAQLKVG